MSYEAEIRMNITEEPKVFLIDREHLTFHDLQMVCADITGMCYGEHVQINMGFTAGGHHFFRFVDSSNDVIQFGMVNWAGNTGPYRNIAQEMEYWIWEYVGNRLVNEMVRTIYCNATVEVGHVRLSRAGIHFIDSRYSGREQQYVIGWHDALGYAENGWLVIRSKTDGAVSTSMQLLNVINAVVLHRIFHYLGGNPELCDILRGLRPPLA